jgi:hypothetical protein
MQKIVATALVILPVALSGCLQMHMDTVIEDDGSGIFTLSYSMSETVAESLEELKEVGMPGQDDMDDAPTLDDFKKDEIEKACKEHGVKVKKFKRATVDGRDKLDIVLAFKNPNDLSAALASTMEHQGGIQLFKTSDGNYTLKVIEVEEKENEASEDDDPSDQEYPQSMQDMDPEKMGKSMEIMGKLMSSISELDVAMRITVPGEILEHNAQRVEDKTLIWEINSSNMMTMGSDASMEPDIVFSGKGIKIDVPTWQP